VRKVDHLLNLLEDLSSDILNQAYLPETHSMLLSHLVFSVPNPTFLNLRFKLFVSFHPTVTAQSAHSNILRCTMTMVGGMC